MKFAFAPFGLGLTLCAAYARSLPEGFFLDGRKTAPNPGAGPGRAHLGLFLSEFQTPNRDGRCLVVHVYTGPESSASALGR